MRPLVHCQLINDPFGDPGLYAEIMFARRAFLFDLGDLRALSTRKLLRVSHVFVSHMHMDHFAGFDQLLRVFLGRDKTLSLYGPVGFIDQVEHKLRAYTWNVIQNYAGNLLLEVAEIPAEGPAAAVRFQSRRAFRREPMPAPEPGDNLLVEQDGLRVRCAVLDHGTPCLAFALEEPAHVNIWKNKLNARGLVVGPWLRDLKRAILTNQPDTTPLSALGRGLLGPEAVTLPLGSLRELAAVVPGQRIAYVVDARFHEANARAIEHLARGADLLFIESVFLDEDREQAARKNHLTARQAGLMARRAQAKQMVPFHFSPRYAALEAALRGEAARAFLGADTDPPGGIPGVSTPAGSGG
jgi:ribonuclease Z